MQPENCQNRGPYEAEAKIREANTGRSEPQNRYSRNHFAQVRACAYPLFLYSPYGQNAKVVYRKTRDGSVVADIHVHIHIHMPVIERSKGQAVPKWALKKEREHEASNPGPGSDQAEDYDPIAGSGEGLLSPTDEAARPKPKGGCCPHQGFERIILETSNVSSAVANALSIWQRKAHIQLLQETLVPPGAAGKHKQEAKDFGKTLEVRPMGPE